MVFVKKIIIIIIIIIIKIHKYRPDRYEFNVIFVACATWASVINRDGYEYEHARSYVP